MPLKNNVAGTQKLIVAWMNVLGTWRKSAVKNNVAGAWKGITALLAVTANNVSGSGGGFAPNGTVTSSGSTNTTVTDGSGSYSFLWQLVSTTSGPAQSVSGVGLQNPTFSANVSDGTPSVCTWRVTVTDTVTGVTATATITVDLLWIDTSD